MPNEPTIEPGLVTLSHDQGRARSHEWARFCLRRRAVEVASDIGCARIELPQIDGPTEFRIATSFAGGKQMRCTLFFVPSGEIDPLPITFCHDTTIANLREGHCLLVPVPDDMEWTDDVWPTSFQELDAFISSSTIAPRFFEAWVERRSRESNKLLMVIAIKKNICYGYLLGSPRIAGLNETRVVPIFFDRIGELTLDLPVPIELELSVKNLEALLRHARSFQAESGDEQVDHRLRQALDELTGALEKGASRSR